MLHSSGSCMRFLTMSLAKLSIALLQSSAIDNGIIDRVGQGSLGINYRVIGGILMRLWFFSRKRLSVVSCLVLLIFLAYGIQNDSALAGTLERGFANDLRELGIAHNSPEYRAAVRACDVLSAPRGLHLTAVSERKASSDDQGIWVVVFETQHREVIRIELDHASLQLEFLIDFSERQPVQRSRNMIASERALDISRDFIMRSVPNIEGARLVGVGRRDESTWGVKWEHVVNNIPVWDDFMEVRIDRLTGSVVSFAKRWSKVSLSPQELVTEEEAVHALIEILPQLKGQKWNSNLAYAYPDVEHGRNGLEIVWILSAADTDSAELEYWISGSDGDLLRIDGLLSYYGDSYISHGNLFSLIDPRWGNYSLNILMHTAEAVQDCISHNNYDSIFSSYPIAQQLANALATKDVVYWTGHGYHEYYLGGLGPTFLCCGPDPNFPLLWFGYTSYPSIVQCKLFFAAACGSALQGPFTVATWALLKHVGCYCGWTVDLMTSVNKKFSRYFFDYAADGNSFDDCKDYAAVKTPLDDDDDFAVLGDGDLHLQRYDRAPSYIHSQDRYDHSVGTYLMHQYYEALWGDDIDAYRKDFEVSHTIMLQVSPCSYLMVKVDVYYWWSGANSRWVMICTDTSSSSGEQAYLSWASGPREYLIVVTYVSSNNDWKGGGYYTLELDSTS